MRDWGRINARARSSTHSPIAALPGGPPRFRTPSRHKPLLTHPLRHTTFAVLRTLVVHIRNGAFDWVAAEAAGLGRRSFYRWLQRGEQGEEPFAELYRRV